MTSSETQIASLQYRYARHSDASLCARRFMDERNGIDVPGVK